MSGTVIFDLTGIAILAAAYHDGRIGSEGKHRDSASSFPIQSNPVESRLYLRGGYDWVA